MLSTRMSVERSRFWREVRMNSRGESSRKIRLVQMRVAIRQAAKISFWVSSSGFELDGNSKDSKRCSTEVRCWLKERISSFVTSVEVDIVS